MIVRKSMVSVADGGGGDGGGGGGGAGGRRAMDLPTRRARGVWQFLRRRLCAALLLALAAAKMDHTKTKSGFTKGEYITPMIAGGAVTKTGSSMSVFGAPSIFRPAGHEGKPRVMSSLPAENPTYPETKHTLKKTVHNITAYPMTDRPGTDTYDPVLAGGKSLCDHYPYTNATSNPCYFVPSFSARG